MSANPFYALTKITDSQYFVGRKAELDFIATKAIAVQPIAVNVVGEKRIGKSSLLYHFFQFYEQQVAKQGANPKNYIAIYLSLKQAQAQSKTGFYRAIAEKFLHRPSVQNDPDLADPLQQPNLAQREFRLALEAWQRKQILPIVCLDEFEEFLEQPDEFNDGFFDNLRSLGEDNLMMFVVASKRSIIDYRKNQNQLSEFGNIFQALMLTEFDEIEIDDLIRLPQTNDSTKSVALDSHRRKLARKWGGKHPFLLQLAASCLWEAKTQMRSEEWARKEFESKAKMVKPTLKPSHFLDLLRWLVWTMPKHLGSLAIWTGNHTEDIWKWFSGTITIIVVILFIIGLLNFKEFKELLESLLGG